MDRVIWAYQARRSGPGTGRSRPRSWPAGALLDPPARPGDPREINQVRSAGCVADVVAVVGDLARVADRAPGQQPVPAPGRPGEADRCPGPVVVTRPVRSGADRQASPRLGRQGGDQLIHTPGGPIGSDHVIVAASREHIAAVVLLQPDPQVLHLPIRLVRGHPRERHVSLDRPLQHRLRQHGLGREGHLIRDPRSPAPGPVGGPPLGQVELPVDQRMPGSARIGHEDTDLAVLDPPGGAGVLPLHAGRAGALLHEPGVIHDQHTIRLAQPVDHVVPHIVTDTVDVPVRPTQQSLHPIRTDLASMLSQRPPILPLEPRDQPRHVLPHPSPRLRTVEPARHRSCKAPSSSTTRSTTTRT